MTVQRDYAWLCLASFRVKIWLWTWPWGRSPTYLLRSVSSFSLSLLCEWSSSRSAEEDPRAVIFRIQLSSNWPKRQDPEQWYQGQCGGNHWPMFTPMMASLGTPLLTVKFKGSCCQQEKEISSQTDCNVHQQVGQLWPGHSWLQKLGEDCVKVGGKEVTSSSGRRRQGLLRTLP